MEGIYTGATDDSFKTKDDIIQELRLRELQALDQNPCYETPLPENRDFTYWNERFLKRAEQKRETDEAVSFARIVLPNHPCLVTTEFDYHGGNEYTDHRAIGRHLQLVKETPFSYMGFGGDLADWYANFAPIQAYNESEQFPEQAEWMWSIFRYLNDGNNPNKMLWANIGNHDDKWAKKTGLSPYHEFSRKFGAYLFKGLSRVEVQVGGISYRGLVTHALQGHSIYNPNHPQARATIENGVYDFIFSGHTHAKGIQQRAYRTADGGRRTVFGQGGTAKRTDYYIQDMGMGDKVPEEMFGNSFIFLPDQKYIVPFDDIDVAHKFFRRYILGIDQPGTE